MKHLNDYNLPEDLKKLDYEQCKQLAQEIRNTIISTVSKNGGHLSSNLGVVELSIALHRVFQSPQDKIVWDVGHQCYTHKILTGRLKDFATLRKEDGISGFPKPEESEHDAFIAGHSSTAVSLACGMAEVMRMENSPHYAIAVVGDGALTGGLSYEGLNNGGKVFEDALKKRNNLIVILNDNEMSISGNVGALSKYLTSIRTKEDYVSTKWKIEHILDDTPVLGKKIVKQLKHTKDAVRNTLYEKSTFFDHLGFVYLGPIDGHNIEELEKAMIVAKKYNRPVLLHIKTVKGKGYLLAEKDPSRFHGIASFDIKTGKTISTVQSDFSAQFGDYLCKLAEYNKNIVALTAAMEDGTGLKEFHKKYPNRFYDVGIAEQHAVTFSAGLASMGKIPVFAVYSSFLQRAYDQLLHDVAISKSHVVLGIDRAGLVGEDGETHQGIFDIAMMTSIPNTTIYAPYHYLELQHCMKKAIFEDSYLSCIRYPRGSEPENSENFMEQYHSWYHHTADDEKQSDILLVSYGKEFAQVKIAKQQLKEKYNLNADTLRLVQIFPLEKKVLDLIGSYKKVYVIEECYAYGNIHGVISREMETATKLYSLSIDHFVKQAKVDRCLKKLHLDADGITEFVFSKEQNI